jgi:hypothetical protein
MTGSVWRTWCDAQLVDGATAVATGNITARYRQASDSAGATADAVADARSAAGRSAAEREQYPGTGLAAPHAGRRVCMSIAPARWCATRRQRPTAARVAGAINYASRVVTLSDYSGGGSPTASVACLTRKGLWEDWRLRFRVSGAPVAAGEPGGARQSGVRQRADQRQQRSLGGDQRRAGGRHGGRAVRHRDAALRGAGRSDAGLSPSEKLEWWYSAPRG